jgi:autotransporter-associated beta strand protein
MKRFGLVLFVGFALVAPANASVVLFDFENALQHAPLPLDLTVGGITAHFSATYTSYPGFSIQYTPDSIGVMPAGFSGLGISPSSVFPADLLVSFPQHVLTDFSIMVAPQELATDTTATLKVSAYMNGTLIGTNTSAATGDTFTWPSSTLSFSSPQGFNNVVVHYQSPPPGGGDWGPIFVADNMSVTPLTIGWKGTSSTNWADAANWTGAVPGTVGTTTNTDTAFFNQNAPYSPLVIDAGRNIQGLTFDTADINSLTIGTTGGNPLRLTNGGTIQTTSTVVNSQTVNAPLAVDGTCYIASNAADSAATLTFGGPIAPAAASGVTTLVLDGSNVGANAVRGPLADNGAGQLSVVKAGSGVWTLSGPNSYSGGTYVSAGVLRFEIVAATPTIAPGSVATVASGAQIDLAGPISALGTPGGNRTQVFNDSTAPGLLVSGTHQVVGGIDGIGDTLITAGSDLTADHIVQDALLIAGTSLSHGLVTIIASDANGNPLTSGSALIGLQSSTEPLGWGASNSLNGMIGAVAGSAIPEPAAMTLLIIAGVASGIIALYWLLCGRRPA